MSTECTTIKEAINRYKPQAQKKPIEFCKFLDEHISCCHITKIPPKNYKHILLVLSAFSAIYDVMLAYDDDIEEGDIYLGHWNDGYVD